MENEEKEGLMNDITISEKLITYLQNIISDQQNVIDSYIAINKKHQSFSETTIHSFINAVQLKHNSSATSVCLNNHQ